MSEDVKPRIWKAISIEWGKDLLVRNVTTFKEEGLSVIELEPTVRLMDEMYDVINSIEICYGDAMYGHGLTEVLKKYKKFKEVLK